VHLAEVRAPIAQARRAQTLDAKARQRSIFDLFESDDEVGGGVRRLLLAA